MNQLPKGWESATLGDIGQYLNGRGFKKTEWSETGRPIIRIQNLTGSTEVTNFYDGEAAERHVVRRGDLLVSWAATLGVFVWSGPEAVLNQHIFKVKSYLDAGFHRYLLENTLGDSRRQAHGSGMVHVTKSKFDQMPIQVPPLAEQRRIVAAIEEHFSHLDAAETDLVEAGIRAKQLSVSACTALTAGDWPRQPLEDVLDSLRNGVFVSRPGASPPGKAILRISSVRPRSLNPSDIRFANPPPENAERYELEMGDLLFTRYSGNPKYVGACAVVPEAGCGLLHPDKLIRGVPDSNVIDPHWVAAYLSVGEGRAEIEKRLKTTAGQVGISGSQLKTVEVPTPPLDTQRELVARIGEFDQIVTSARRTIEMAAQRSTALRRSILVAAFSGRLASQDPSDEPASVLLERIASERAASKPSRKKKVTS